MTYNDSDGTIDASTIGTDDLSIGGLTCTGATIVSGSGTATTVVDYTFTPPGGTWNTADNATYSVALGSGPVKDNSAAAVASLTAGAADSSITVNIPTPTITSAGTANFAENGTGTAYTAAATVSAGGGGADTSKFNIDSSTGAVTFKTAPNYESPADTGANDVYDIIVTATDSNGSANKSVAITVTDVNEAPVLTAGGTLAFTEGNAATAIDATITVTDVDDTNIAGATVTISAGFTSGDVLAFTNQNGVSGSWDSGTHVLTLTGTTTKANYQTALRSVTYTTTSGTPTSGSASRTITWAVTDANAAGDGAKTSTGVTSTINLTAANTKPTVTAGGTLAYNENGAATAIDTGITITDPDDASMTGATVTISAGFTTGDVLAFTDQNGITGSWNSSTGVLTLSGTATKAQYATALASVTFASSSDTPTSSSASRTITWTVTDANAEALGAQTSTGVTSTVNITAVNDKPVLTAGSTLAFTEGDSATAIDTTITVTDVDDTNIAGATVTISAGFTSGDVLAFTNQNGITGSWDSGTHVLTLTGTTTKANYQTALRSVTYTTSSGTPTSSSASRTVTWAVTDAASTGGNGAQTSTGVDSTINLTAANTKPTVTAGTTLAYTEKGAAAAIDTGLTITDPDDTNMAGATVTISSGFTSGDVLAFTDQNGITGSWDSGTHVLTLTGTATKGNYQTALRSVTFASSSDTPTSSSASRTITWTVTDGNAEAIGAQTSTGVTSTVNITAVNSKPVLTHGNRLKASWCCEDAGEEIVADGG